MPTYEYRCLNCGHHIEVVQRFSDEPLRKCPECGGPLRRVYHPVGIVLKGSGFYSTDNRSGSKHRSEPKKESGDETKPAETKKESKKETSPSPESSARESTSSSKKSGGSSSSRNRS